MKKLSDRKKINIIIILPLIIMGGLFLFFKVKYGKTSIEDVLNFTPSNYFLTAIIIILIYAVKSISMFIPLSILYLSASTIFSSYWAILIHLIGLTVCMTIPYFIGRFSGTTLLDKVISRYPKIGKIMEIEGESQWFFVFIIKMIGIIPNEVSSLVLGSLNTKYKTYITAAVLAKVPSMMATTLLGSNIKTSK